MVWSKTLPGETSVKYIYIKQHDKSKYSLIVSKNKKRHIWTHAWVLFKTMVQIGPLKLAEEKFEGNW